MLSVLPFTRTYCINVIHFTIYMYKCGSRIKAGFFYFCPNFSTQMNVSLPFEGHNVAYQCKGLDQSNIVCEYAVNLLTNERVITEKQNFNTNRYRTMLKIKVTILHVHEKVLT